MAEDGTFRSHGGVDWFEVRESFEKNVREFRAARGASTITQQLAKNLYLSTSKDPLRKAKELVITLLLEQSAVEGQDPGDLPERDRMGAGGVRRRGGVEDFFRKVRRVAHARRGAAAGRGDPQPAASRAEPGEPLRPAPGGDRPAEARSQEFLARPSAAGGA